MRSLPGRRIAALVLTALALLLLSEFGVLAKSDAPPPDAIPGSYGFSGSTLAVVDTSIVPGYQLQLVESVVRPGAYVTSHANPAVVLVCVRSGALGFALQHGSATVTWNTPSAVPPANDPLLSGDATVQRQFLPGAEITLQARDCVSFDHFAGRTAHTSWNASDGQTVLIEARLVEMASPSILFLDALGNPVAS